MHVSVREQRKVEGLIQRAEQPLNEHIKRVRAEIGQDEKRDAEMRNDKPAKQNGKADQYFFDRTLHIVCPRFDR